LLQRSTIHINARDQLECGRSFDFAYPILTARAHTGDGYSDRHS
jgi:hypothetical protein